MNSNHREINNITISSNNIQTVVKTTVGSTNSNSTQTNMITTIGISSNMLTQETTTRSAEASIT